MAMYTNKQTTVDISNTRSDSADYISTCCKVYPVQLNNIKCAASVHIP